MRHLIILIAITLTACSESIIVHTDFDKSVEVHRLTNYSWLDVKSIESRNNPLYINELTDKRIKTAVDRELKTKGYVLSDESAQVIVHYHIAIEHKTAIRTEPYGYFYSSYWMETHADVVRYREGTLIVDFMDVRNCDLIWRGWAVSILDDQKLINEEMINEAVKKIFASFPKSAALEVREP